MGLETNLGEIDVDWGVGMAVHKLKCYHVKIILPNRNYY